MIQPSLILFLDFGGGEIMIILLVILIVLGPDKIPAFAKQAGQVIRYVRRATDDIKKEINKETEDLKAPIKSAYQSATSFSENAHKAMKATLTEIEMEEGKDKNQTKKSTIEEEKSDDNSTAKQ